MSFFVKVFFSMRTTAMLLIIFATVVGVATFVENDYGTDAAKSLVFNAKWFESLLLLLGLNLIGNIFTYKMYKKEKFPILLFHISFIVVLIGAGVTRYFGYEGMMHIREGDSVSTIHSVDSYIQIKAEDEDKIYSLNIKYQPSIFFDNNLNRELELNNERFRVNLKKYIVSAISEIEDVKDGDEIISLAVSSMGSARRDVAIKRGESLIVGENSISFDDMQNLQADFFIRSTKSGLEFSSGYMISYFDTHTQEQGELKDNITHPLKEGLVVNSNGLSIVLKEHKESAKKIYKPGNSRDSNIDDLFLFEISSKNSTQELMVFGKNGAIPKFSTTYIDSYKFDVGFGSKEITLPFALKLNSFELERYPGSNSPSSYASNVTLLDDEVSFDYRIFMNHILDYGGYRFYQASYDRDEKGTILSVNRDYYGTLITYIGYTIMILGMLVALFYSHGRVRKLYSKFSKSSPLAILAATFILLSTTTLDANNTTNSQEHIDLIEEILSINRDHSDRFAKLLVQDHNGRVKPIDTLARDVIHKLSGKETILELAPSQILLGMVVRPNAWQNVKMIKVSHPELKEILGIKKSDKLAAFVDFFDTSEGRNSYKLAELIESASRKRPSEQNKLDRDVLKVDERLNISYMVFTGSLLRILPKANDANQKWYAPMDAFELFDDNDKESVRSMIFAYFKSIDQAIESGDWSMSEKILSQMDEYQRFYGASIYPSKSKIDAEILYNSLNIFKNLFPLYLLVGFILLIISIIHIIKPISKISLFVKISIAFLGVGFIAQTFGLMLRWYISGHAPWSDSYESMIYIAWASILAGFLFVRSTPVALSATAILAGVVLFVSHLSWMDPQITTLVPVLDSYWLIIHVAVITASYGFFGLGALLGLIVLILYSIRSIKNYKPIDNSIKEITYINETALIIGLLFLTIGNFLGGVWANESWGRYWGWDPKESWSLVTILVYAVVIHLRFIPNLKDAFIFNVASLFSLSSVLMTYFGVNFYLSGLHSYAKGDPVPIPSWVYVTLITLIVLTLIAAFKKALVDRDKAKSKAE